MTLVSVIALATFSTGTLIALAQTASTTPEKTSLEHTSPDYFGTPVNGGPGGVQQPPLTKEEIKMFIEETRNMGRDASQLVKDMKGTNVAAETQQALQHVIDEARRCIESVQKTGVSEESRQLMQECRSQNLWNDINDARQDFVPPREVKEALRQVTQHEREMKTVRKQMAKLSLNTAAADEILTRITAMRTAIENATGQNQRDAMQDFYDERVWEVINNLRSSIDIPRELKRLEKDIARLPKLATAKQNQKAFEFFGVQGSAITKLVDEKVAAIENIKKMAAQGEFEDARQEMNDSVYQGWHPGDLVHAIDMLREIHQRVKSIKAADVQTQVKEIIDPVVEEMIDGDVRSSNKTLEIVRQQLQRIEFKFRRGSGDDEMELDDRSQQALEKFEQLIDARERDSSAPQQ